MGGKHYKTEMERLEAFTRKTANHWFWIGPRTGLKGAYGLFWFKGNQEVAHRAAYRLLVGPIPERMDVHHKCKVKLCVNPDHLKPVTRSEHLLLEPSARRKKKCIHGHSLSGSNLYEYHDKTGHLRHICRTCNRLRQRKS
jgi:hypothetical protein